MRQWRRSAEARLRRDSEMDGLLLGAATGMRFAALESTGYAFTAFVASRGHVGVSIVETILRGMLAPFGHGVWTAILAAVLVRRSAPHHFRISGSVVLTYLFVSLLHGLWDGLPRVLYVVVPPGIPISVVTLTLSAIGIIVLVALYRQAERRQLMPPSPLEPLVTCVSRSFADANAALLLASACCGALHPRAEAGGLSRLKASNRKQQRLRIDQAQARPLVQQLLGQAPQPLPL
jgi:hypothetical protein